jgi:hypothetical protein
MWEMQVSTGLLHQPGMRTSAKLTTGFRQQKKMRIDLDAVKIIPKPQAHVGSTGKGSKQGGGFGSQLKNEGGTAESSDDEFAPPDALAVARMKSRLAGDAEADPLADL